MLFIFETCSIIHVCIFRFSFFMFEPVFHVLFFIIGLLLAFPGGWQRGLYCSCLRPFVLRGASLHNYGSLSLPSLLPFLFLAGSVGYTASLSSLVLRGASLHNYGSLSLPSLLRGASLHNYGSLSLPSFPFLFSVSSCLVVPSFCP